jgi:hypothetical protein
MYRMSQMRVLKDSVKDALKNSTAKQTLSPRSWTRSWTPCTSHGTMQTFKISCKPLLFTLQAIPVTRRGLSWEAANLIQNSSQQNPLWRSQHKRWTAIFHNKCSTSYLKILTLRTCRKKADTFTSTRSLICVKVPAFPMYSQQTCT